MVNASVLMEVCVDSVASAVIAQEAGAHRVELCDNLLEGGTTPSAGMLQLCREHLAIGLHALIRPRRGDFLYTDLEFEVMKHDIASAKDLGADGVVLGILRPNGQIDLPRTKELVQLAHPMSVTFHRAYDLTPEPLKALNDLKALGVTRLLTSGQQVTALEGAALISQLVQQAGKDLVILPGGGITEENLEELLEKTGVKEFHASAREWLESPMEFRRDNVPMGGTPLPTEYGHMVASPHRIKKLLDTANQFNQH